MAKITSTDVAKLAGVSQSTVSFVFNNRTDISISQTTRAKVIDAAKQLGYGPFSNSSSFFASDLVAVLVPSFDNPFYSTVLSLISDELNKKNIKMLVYCTNKSKDNEILALANANIPSVFSILYLYTPIAKDEAINLAKQKKMYILGEVDYSINASIITLSSKKAGYLAAQHLYELGHRHIAYISNPIDNISMSRKRRLEGILEFAREVGIEKNIVVKISNDETESASELNTGYYSTLSIISEEKDVTALICANDYTALGVLNALSHLRLTAPDYMSVVGFDNLSLTSTFRPKLTTVDHLIKERVHHVVELIVSETSSRNIHITYDPKLITRETTSKPRS